jgi:hypothetical protein
VASDDCSCAAAVAHIQAWAQQRGLPVPAGGTSSYREARAKLPVEMLRAVNDCLYMHRWEIEVRFRDIKTTLGMELLRTKTPAMLEKELCPLAVSSGFEVGEG